MYITTGNARWWVRRIAMAAVVFAIVAFVGEAVRRARRPSVVRDAIFTNESGSPMAVMVASIPARKVVDVVAVLPHQEVVVRVYEGDSTREYEYTKYVIVMWRDDGASRSTVISGAKLDADMGRVNWKTREHE